MTDDIYDKWRKDGRDDRITGNAGLPGEPQCAQEPDIVERLRTKHVYGTFEIEQQRQDAADEIERLRLEITQAEIMAIGDTVTTLRKMGHGAPVAYACFTDNGNIRLWSTNHAEIEAWAKTVGRTVTPLYATLSQAKEPEASGGLCAIAPHAVRVGAASADLPTTSEHMDVTDRRDGHFHSSEETVSPPTSEYLKGYAIGLHDGEVKARSEEREEAPDDFYAGKSDIELARHINLALLMCQGISEEDAGFDHVTTLNDPGLAAVARIIGNIRASPRSHTSVTSRPFHGARCSSYPNCTGFPPCGLGCTKEMERLEVTTALPTDDLLACTVSFSGTEITIQCNDHDVKDRLMDFLTGDGASPRSGS